MMGIECIRISRAPIRRRYFSTLGMKIKVIADEHHLITQWKKILLFEGWAVADNETSLQITMTVFQLNIPLRGIRRRRRLLWRRNNESLNKAIATQSDGRKNFFKGGFEGWIHCCDPSRHECMPPHGSIQPIIVQDSGVPRWIFCRAGRPSTVVRCFGSRPKPGRMERMFIAVRTAPASISATA